MKNILSAPLSMSKGSYLCWSMVLCLKAEKSLKDLVSHRVLSLIQKPDEIPHMGELGDRGCQLYRVMALSHKNGRLLMPPTVSCFYFSTLSWRDNADVSEATGNDYQLCLGRWVVRS